MTGPMRCKRGEIATLLSAQVDERRKPRTKSTVNDLRA
jgi:hypothetical protein